MSRYRGLSDVDRLRLQARLSRNPDRLLPVSMEDGMAQRKGLMDDPLAEHAVAAMFQTTTDPEGDLIERVMTVDVGVNVGSRTTMRVYEVHHRTLYSMPRASDNKPTLQTAIFASAILREAENAGVKHLVLDGRGMGPELADRLRAAGLEVELSYPGTKAVRVLRKGEMK